MRGFSRTVCLRLVLVSMPALAAGCFEFAEIEDRSNTISDNSEIDTDTDYPSTDTSPSHYTYVPRESTDNIPDPPSSDSPQETDSNIFIDTETSDTNSTDMPPTDTDSTDMPSTDTESTPIYGCTADALVGYWARVYDDPSTPGTTGETYDIREDGTLHYTKEDSIEGHAEAHWNWSVGNDSIMLSKSAPDDSDTRILKSFSCSIVDGKWYFDYPVLTNPSSTAGEMEGAWSNLDIAGELTYNRTEERYEGTAVTHQYRIKIEGASFLFEQTTVNAIVAKAPSDTEFVILDSESKSGAGSGEYWKTENEVYVALSSYTPQSEAFCPIGEACLLGYHISDGVFVSSASSPVRLDSLGFTRIRTDSGDALSMEETLYRHAKVRCEKRQECLPYHLVKSYGSVENCILRSYDSELRYLMLPGLNESIATYAVCTAQTEARSCHEWLRGTPPACMPRGGLIDGEACISKNQCVSGWCRFTDEHCGVCAPMPAVGDPCDALSQCPTFEDEALWCMPDNTCRIPGELGQRCDDDSYCQTELTCHQGTCVESPGIGEACDVDAGLYCDVWIENGICDQDGVCIERKWSGPEGACSTWEGDKWAVCGSNTRCVENPDSGESYCTALSEEGDPCDSEVGPGCAAGLSCLEGFCRFSDQLYDMCLQPPDGNVDTDSDMDAGLEPDTDHLTNMDTQTGADTDSGADTDAGAGDDTDPDRHTESEIKPERHPDAGPDAGEH